MELILVVALVAGAYMLFSRFRERRVVRATQGIAPEAPTADPGPTFNVVALGARGSGKTLLLASMYHELQTPAGRPYFITAPFDQVLALNEWYSETANTDLDWPAGTSTGDTRRFEFTFHTRMPRGDTRPVMRVSYLEYAGGLLTDVQAPGSTVQEHLLRSVESAHALIGVIDGYRIRQMIDGVPAGRNALRQSLDVMINLMMRQTCPVTFVVTKWDLLEDLDVDEDARLQIVKKRLMQFAGFRDLVDQHLYRRVVRFIPVSAVGPDFATLDDRGQVTKIPGGEVHPSRVDVPLCAIVPDLFEQVERDVDASHLKAEFERIRRQTRLGPMAAISELGTYVARAAGSSLVGLTGQGQFLGQATLQMIFGAEDAERLEQQKAVDRQVTAVEQDMLDFHKARRAVLREFRRRVDVLEGRLPSSRLTSQD